MFFANVDGAFGGACSVVPAFGAAVGETAVTFAEPSTATSRGKPQPRPGVSGASVPRGARRTTRIAVGLTPQISLGEDQGQGYTAPGRRAQVLGSKLNLGAAFASGPRPSRKPEAVVCCRSKLPQTSPAPQTPHPYRHRQHSRKTNFLSLCDGARACRRAGAPR